MHQLKSTQYPNLCMYANSTCRPFATLVVYYQTYTIIRHSCTDDVVQQMVYYFHILLYIYPFSLLGPEFHSFHVVGVQGGAIRTCPRRVRAAFFLRPPTSPFVDRMKGKTKLYCYIYSDIPTNVSFRVSPEIMDVGHRHPPRGK